METMLAAEMTEHLGHEPNEAEGRVIGNVVSRPLSCLARVPRPARPELEITAEPQEEGPGLADCSTGD